MEMIKDVQAALAVHGLSLNMDKCMVQTSNPDVLLQDIMVNGQHIPMVCANVGFKVLGTQFTLRGRTSVELKCRIAAAWKKFYALWPLLGKRDGNLVQKLRLFDGTVTSTVLWCNESWIITKKEKSLLVATQNSMLRRIAGPRRKPDEPWLDWMLKALGYEFG